MKVNEVFCGPQQVEEEGFESRYRLQIIEITDKTRFGIFFFAFLCLLFYFLFSHFHFTEIHVNILDVSSTKKSFLRAT